MPKEEAGTLLRNVHLSVVLESQKIRKHYSLLRQVLQSEAPPCLSFAKVDITSFHECIRTSDESKSV